MSTPPATPAATPPVHAASRYRLDRRHAVRLLGVRMVVAAVLVVAAAVVLGARPDGPLRVVGVVLAVLAAAAVLVAVLVLAVPPLVVRLAPDGYRVRRVPDCGVRSARWDAVAGARTGGNELGQTLEIVLHDGSRTVLPLVLVAGRARALVLEVRARLDVEHGYRRLPTTDQPGSQPGGQPGAAGSPPPPVT